MTSAPAAAFPGGAEVVVPRRFLRALDALTDAELLVASREVARRAQAVRMTSPIYRAQVEAGRAAAASRGYTNIG